MQLGNGLLKTRKNFTLMLNDAVLFLITLQQLFLLIILWAVSLLSDRAMDLENTSHRSGQDLVHVTIKMEL